jgi:antitoxin ParD1/3/4
MKDQEQNKKHTSTTLKLSETDIAAIALPRRSIMANAGRNISLTDALGAFVDEQVTLGRHATGSEVVREALRRYQDDIKREQVHLDYLRSLAERGEADIAAGRYAELATPDAVRAHIRNRAARRGRGAG